MVQLAAIVASYAVSEYRLMLTVTLDVGVTPVEVQEIGATFGMTFELFDLAVPGNRPQSLRS